MIISASRRTDIPAFYAEWFRNRLEAGFCTVPNPMNTTQVAWVSLRPADVDAIVFWTRNPKPLFPTLETLDRQGILYYFQYTITGYGRPVETSNPPVDTAVCTFRELAGRLPPGRVIWRYDPILLGEEFPPAMHIERFRSIAERLAGHTDRVVISLVDLYRKTLRRMGKILQIGTALSAEPEAEREAESLLGELARIANGCGMEMESCAEKADYAHLGIGHTKCVDDRLLRKFAPDREWPSKKDKGQRKLCGCVVSKDIGIPNTCLFGCAYCYATSSNAAAAKRYREHNPASPSLWGWFKAPEPSSVPFQLSLF